LKCLTVQGYLCCSSGRLRFMRLRERSVCLFLRMIYVNVLHFRSWRLVS
jgi:hypothetical protein